jgi:hypothetical protein
VEDDFFAEDDGLAGEGSELGIVREVAPAEGAGGGANAAISRNSCFWPRGQGSSCSATEPSAAVQR